MIPTLLNPQRTGEKAKWISWWEESAKPDTFYLCFALMQRVKLAFHRHHLLLLHECKIICIINGLVTKTSRVHVRRCCKKSKESLIDMFEISIDMFVFNKIFTMLSSCYEPICNLTVTWFTKCYSSINLFFYFQSPTEWIRDASFFFTW